MISNIPREFQRPQGFRFAFGGVKLRSVPDALPPTKYAAAQNIRAVSDQSVQARPGYIEMFTTGGNLITDIRAYATLGTDDIPRFLARDAANSIYLDNGLIVATLAGYVTPGVSMLPFRPSASAQSWMYIASSEDYQKLSAPDLAGAVVAQKVGIAEPQAQLEAAPLAPLFTDFTGVAADWTPSGTAGALSNDDLGGGASVSVVMADPASATRRSFNTVLSTRYFSGQLLTFAGANTFPVLDRTPAVGGGALRIRAIRYDSGAAGACTIVVGALPSEGILGQLGGLRRGARLNLNFTESVLVHSVLLGTDSAAIRTSTTAAHAAGEVVLGVVSQVVDSGTVAFGQAITSPVIKSTLTVGTASIARAWAANPFTAVYPGTTTLPREDDYVHILIDGINSLTTESIDVVFTYGGTDVCRYRIEGASLEGARRVLSFPISALLPSSNSGGYTLADATGIRLDIVMTENWTLRFGSLWVGGGSEPDVSEDGAPYRYRAVPRSSLTGVKGNATPDMRYGVRPQRQSVTVALPGAHPDPQVDTWDIYRYGGSVTSFRYVGSAPITAATFTDTYFDDTALAGLELEIDNFEPWPSVDVPYKVTSAGAAIVVVGNWLTVTGPAAWPALIERWLPGTLIQFEGGTTYTLRARPVQLSAVSYLFELEENAGYNPALGSVWILEPRVAAQPLPYVWGPNEYGDVFAVGDPLRPGTVYFAKSFRPDNAPDTYNLELAPPSEPLVGGSLLGGIALVSSTTRWWALYPAFQTPQRYTQIERNVGRALIAPFAHCTDGQRVFFWAKDCIAATDGGPFQSLTDEDLYNLFTHEGVAGQDIVRHGVTYYAPDYGRAAEFRLSVANCCLYADYRDNSGTPRTLVCDLRTGAWSTDVYADFLTCHYATEQQAGPLGGGFVALYPVVVMPSLTGKVFMQVECASDNGVGISCVVATFEWDGGDQRDQPLWGDAYLDCEPVYPITVTPVSQETGVVAPTVVPASASRQFAPISVGGGALRKFLGLLLTWTEGP